MAPGGGNPVEQSQNQQSDAKEDHQANPAQIFGQGQHGKLGSEPVEEPVACQDNYDRTIDHHQQQDGEDERGQQVPDPTEGAPAVDFGRDGHETAKASGGGGDGHDQSGQEKTARLVGEYIGDIIGEQVHDLGREDGLQEADD